MKVCGAMLAIHLVAFTCLALEGATVPQEACAQNDTSPLDVIAYVQTHSTGQRRRRKSCTAGSIPLGDECPDGQNDCCENSDKQTVCGAVDFKGADFYVEQKYKYACCNSWNVYYTGVAFCANPPGGDCPAERVDGKAWTDNFCQSCPCPGNIVECNYCDPKWGNFTTICDEKKCRDPDTINWHRRRHR
eukprot:TRINITY_DN19436_c0_g1_i1.p1 TRINITY_DN19436_c0_g1~~TRINITY_DN19436_c0_g1_i1.p1  ORF type:complete len:189 (-),score=19.77 TRINITY_DN19436_c0_g1_i1:81-647(-)